MDPSLVDYLTKNGQDASIQSRANLAAKNGLVKSPEEYITLANKGANATINTQLLSILSNKGKGNVSSNMGSSSIPLLNKTATTATTSASTALNPTVPQSTLPGSDTTKTQTSNGNGGSSVIQPPQNSPAQNPQNPVQSTSQNYATTATNNATTSFNSTLDTINQSFNSQQQSLTSQFNADLQSLQDQQDAAIAEARVAFAQANPEGGPNSDEGDYTGAINDRFNTQREQLHSQYQASLAQLTSQKSAAIAQANNDYANSKNTILSNAASLENDQAKFQLTTQQDAQRNFMSLISTFGTPDKDPSKMTLDEISPYLQFGQKAGLSMSDTVSLLTQATLKQKADQAAQDYKAFQEQQAQIKDVQNQEKIQQGQERVAIAAENASTAAERAATAAASAASLEQYRAAQTKRAYSTIVSSVIRNLYPTNSNPLQVYNNSSQVAGRLDVAYQNAIDPKNKNKGASDLDLIDSYVQMARGGKNLTETQVSTLLSSFGIKAKFDVATQRITGSALLDNGTRDSIHTQAQSILQEQRTAASNGVDVINSQLIRQGVPTDSLLNGVDDALSALGTPPPPTGTSGGSMSGSGLDPAAQSILDKYKIK